MRVWVDVKRNSPRRGHVITQHGLIATGPLAGPQLRLHRTQGSDRSQAQVTHRAIATAQSLRTPGIVQWILKRRELVTWPWFTILSSGC